MRHLHFLIEVPPRVPVTKYSNGEVPERKWPQPQNYTEPGDQVFDEDENQDERF